MCMITHVAVVGILALTFKNLTAYSFIAIFAVSSFFMGMLENYIMPMFAAASDYGAWKTGNRLDGITMSIYSLTITSGVLIATFIRSGVLMAVNLDAVTAGGEITSAFVGGLGNLFSWIPFVMSLLSLVFVLLVPLNDKRIAQINEDIAAGITAKDSTLKL